MKPLTVGEEAREQLRLSGFDIFLTDIVVLERCVRARIFDPPLLLECLRDDPRFKEGIFFGAHPEMGRRADLTEFRGHRDAVGRGSLQMVVNHRTREFYADVDEYSFYEDVVGIIGHSYEVVRNVWRRLRAKLAS